MPVAKRTQQGGGNIIWSGIADQTIMVNEGVELRCDEYCNFMDKTFFAWYKSQSCSFIVKCVFVPVKMLLLMYLSLPVNSLSIKYLLENQLSIVKMKLYEGDKQYNIKADLWEAIKTTMSEIEPAEVKKDYKING